MALDWMQGVRPCKVLIASASNNALISIEHNQSETNQDNMGANTYAARNEESRTRDQAHLGPNTKRN